MGTRWNHGRPPWWDYHGLANYYQTLKIETVHVPNEVLTLIAENCVEPYSFVSPGLLGRKALSRVFKNNNRFHTPLYELATISRLFYHGIKKALVQHFTGEVTIKNIKYLQSKVNQYVQENRLEWVMTKVTHIYLLNKPENIFLDPSVQLTQFSNLRTVALVCDDSSRFNTYSTEEKLESIAMENAKKMRSSMERTRALSSRGDEFANLQIVAERCYGWKTSYGMSTLTIKIDISKEPPVVVEKKRSEKYYDDERLACIMSRKPSP